MDSLAVISVLQHKDFLTIGTMATDPEPKPEPVKAPIDWMKLVGPLFITAGLIFVGIKGIPVLPLPGPGPGPAPKPVVVVTKFDPADTVVELAGVRLDAEKTKLFCDVVNAGDGAFQITYQPIGKAKEIRKVVVSGGVVPPEPEPPVPPGPPPAPVVVPELLKPAVEALKPYAAPRAALSKFYADFAGVLEFSDPNQLQTTAQVRDALVASLKQFTSTGVMSNAPKIGQHIDAYLASQVPLDDGTLDADKRTKLIAAYKTVAEVLK